MYTVFNTAIFINALFQSQNYDLNLCLQWGHDTQLIFSCMFSWDIQTICISKGLVFTPFQENYEYFTILSDKTFFFCQMLPLNDDDPGHFPKQYIILWNVQDSLCHTLTFLDTALSKYKKASQYLMILYFKLQIVYTIWSLIRRLQQHCSHIFSVRGSFTLCWLFIEE